MRVVRPGGAARRGRTVSAGRRRVVVGGAGTRGRVGDRRVRVAGRGRSGPGPVASGSGRRRHRWRGARRGRVVVPACGPPSARTGPHTVGGGAEPWAPGVRLERKPSDGNGPNPLFFERISVPGLRKARTRTGAEDQSALVGGRRSVGELCHPRELGPSPAVTFSGSCVKRPCDPWRGTSGDHRRATAGRESVDRPCGGGRLPRPARRPEHGPQPDRRAGRPSGSGRPARWGGRGRRDGRGAGAAAGHRCGQRLERPPGAVLSWLAGARGTATTGRPSRPG